LVDSELGGQDVGSDDKFFDVVDRLDGGDGAGTSLLGIISEGVVRLLLGSAKGHRGGLEWLAGRDKHREVALLRAVSGSMLARGLSGSKSSFLSEHLFCLSSASFASRFFSRPCSSTCVNNGGILMEARSSLLRWILFSLSHS